jgi:hypothetical protein
LITKRFDLSSHHARIELIAARIELVAARTRSATRLIFARAALGALRTPSDESREKAWLSCSSVSEPGP